MLDWSQCAAVERTPEKVSGAWVFKGTRVPVKALFENLEGGARVDDFLEWFPGVTREQAEAVLRHAEQSLVAAWGREPVLVELVEVFFGPGTPAPLRQTLFGHTISTAYEMGWATLENGDLLNAAEASFDAFITTDQNLRSQQDLRARRLAILVLPTTSWPMIQLHLPKVITAVSELRTGDFVELSFS
jgi:uncharacterized protein (DUF433 family)